jgi:hypothetical protein
MTRKEAREIFPHLKLYTDWKKVAEDNLATKTQLKKLKMFHKDMKPVGVYPSHFDRNKAFFLYEKPTATTEKTDNSKKL